jgi:hypothetical protein
MYFSCQIHVPLSPPAGQRPGYRPGERHLKINFVTASIKTHTYSADFVKRNSSYHKRVVESLAAILKGFISAGIDKFSQISSDSFPLLLKTIHMATRGEILL